MTKLSCFDNTEQILATKWQLIIWVVEHYSLAKSFSSDISLKLHDVCVLFFEKMCGDTVIIKGCCFHVGNL